MSALDQQVAEARQELVDASREQCRCGPGADEPCQTCEDWMEAYDALLTTHRRQVLTEIEEKIRTDAGWRWRSRGEAADFVASLRDTKEG